MTAVRRKILSDLSLEGVRSVLVVAAIAAGITGFTAVLSSYAILTRELNAQYLATDPPSAILRMDAVDDALVSAVSSLPGVRDAEARRIVQGQIKGVRSGWANLQLFVVRDFSSIRIGKLSPQQGGWPPAPGEILIERDAMQVARLQIGDSARVKATGGKESTLRVTGTVHDVGQAQARMENLVYGYISLETLSRLGQQPQLDRLQILVPDKPFDQAHNRSVAADVRKFVESRGHVVQRVDVPVPGEHPHGRLMALLLLVMSCFGFAILALSGVLVVNLLTAMMATQIRQIGVMKAVGGSTGQIAIVYLAEALLLGLTAAAIAIPAGIWGGRALCRAMAVFLNFDIPSFAVPFWVYLLAVIAGALVPLASAAWPVWNVARVPVRHALGEMGMVNDGFGTRSFDRLLIRLGGSARPALLALRNTFRRRSRLLLTLATLTAGGLFFLSALNIRSSMVHTLDRFFATRRFDLMVTLTGTADRETVRQAASQTPGVVDSEGWLVQDATLSTSDHFPLVGLPPGGKFMVPDIQSGRPLLPDDRDVVLINTALAASAVHPEVGQTLAVRIGDQEVKLRVVGIAREQFAPPAAYVPIASLQHPDRVNSVRLRLAHTDRASIDAVKSAFESQLEQARVVSRGSQSTADSRYGFDQHMLMVYVFLVIVAALIGGIGGLGLMTTMSLNVLERRREMGVIRALGATPAEIAGMVVAESALVALASWLCAALLSWPLSRILGSLVSAALFRGGLDFRLDLAGLAIWFTVSLLLGVTSGLLPAWTASRLPVREALLHE